MRHPNEETLALHAGGDLGRLARWRTARHVARCQPCQAEVAVFRAVCEQAPALGEMPEIDWGPLALEMRAHIRAGLAEEPAAGWRNAFTFARMAAAAASVAFMVLTGIALQRGAPAPAPEVEVRATANGVQWQSGQQAMRFLHGDLKREDVTYQAGAQGSMQTSFVDPQTNLVTVTNVYAD